MSYLLDTHVVLCLLGEPQRLPAWVRETLADRANTLLVSAVSAMEVATKFRLGKLDVARGLVDSWDARVHDIDGEELPLSARHALAAGAMTWAHRDPFDRMLAAQSMLENAPLVSGDVAMSELPGLRLLSW
ncbi:MAG TPA: type II toxin-antitoxin system VapC family toxin [Nocardioidaceae bacterium]|nr:type II toxin-antitoxin system VapC family toxin [Nocardioidaceae bacterium]